jgi:poly(hydroxyalkanoate) depolymerase family esterase
LHDLNAPPEWTVIKEKVQRARRGTPEVRRTPPPTPDPRAPGAFLQGTFSAAAGQRRYRLYVPSTPSDRPRPLIVMLHGCTQNAEDFAAGTEMNALAEQHGCLVLYPEQPRSANATLRWNWFEALHQEREGGEPSLIAGMTREVIARWQADPGRVYAAGLSAGGAMAAIMGATHPELYAAIGVHSGLPVGKARDLITGLAAMKRAKAGRGRAAGKLRQRVPVIVFHGDSDNVVHAENGEAILDQFLRPAPDTAAAPLRRTQEYGTAPSGRGYTRTSMIDDNGRHVAEHWELHGAGHAWSGGSAHGSYTDPSGPGASAEMLRFFLNQPSNCNAL